MTRRRRGRWALCEEGLRYADRLTVSFQRCAVAARAATTPPSSLGVARLAARGAGFALPLRRDEAVWIGLLAEDGPLAVEVRGRIAGAWQALAPQEVSPQLSVVLAMGARPARPLARRFGLEALVIAAEDVAAEIDVVAAGRAAAADPADAYGGWRLP